MLSYLEQKGVFMKAIIFLLVCMFSSLTFAVPGGPHKVVANSRLIYSSTNVTTAAWVTVLASTPQSLTGVSIFDSSGQTMKLGDFDSTCTTLLQTELIIPPGGQGPDAMSTTKGDCIRIRAMSGTANSGESDINFFY